MRESKGRDNNRSIIGNVVLVREEKDVAIGRER